MLIIREEQMALFRRAAEAEFESRVVAHLQNTYPSRVSRLGDGEIRAFAGNAIARARKHRFETERDITVFVELALLHGAAFDEEPWAAEVLQDEFILDASLRADTLFDRAQEQADKRAGA